MNVHDELLGADFVEHRVKHMQVTFSIQIDNIILYFNGCIFRLA